MYNAKILSTMLYIYKLIYSTDYKKTDDRKLFYIIYLLHQKGIVLSDLYDFQWLHNTIYSFALSSEIRHLNLNIVVYKMEKPIELSNDAQQAISEIKEFIDIETEYDATTWIKGLATAHYLKKYILFNNDGLKTVAKKLHDINPVRFCKTDENIKICNLISNL